jgi:hypothetical protein
VATKPKPWDRLTKEPESSYALFLIYRDMGAKRSLEKLAEGDFGASEGGDRQATDGPPVPAASQLRRLSARWQWVERCRAWDNHLREARDDEIRKEAAKVARRHQQWIEKVYEHSQILEERARRLEAFPVQRTKLDADGKTTIIEPGRHISREVTQLMETANTLANAYFEAKVADPAAMSKAEMEGVASILGR